MTGLPYKNITRTENGVTYLGDVSRLSSFEKDYLSVREKEGRLFSDKNVRLLPDLPKSHPLSNEWLYRADTKKRFCKFLKTHKKAQAILDLGCGNGWFSKILKSTLPTALIYALDVNTHELHQGANLFRNDGIVFLHGDIFKDIFIPGSFDMIILNSSIQYFPDIKKLLNRLLELLSKGGEIHIIDSPIYYSKEQQQEATKRSKKYFSDLGEEKMAQHYHHHKFSPSQEYNFEVLYNPKRYSSFLFRFFRRKTSPFPWIRVRNF